MNFHVHIEGYNLDELKAITEALNKIEYPEKPLKQAMCAGTGVLAADGAENAPEPTSAPTGEPEPKSEKAAKSKKTEVTKPKDDAVVAGSPCQGSSPEEPPFTPDKQDAPKAGEQSKETETVTIDVAACRGLATKAIQKNLANEVNAIVKATGAASLSKIPEDKLPEVYNKLKELVG